MALKFQSVISPGTFLMKFILSYPSLSSIYSFPLTLIILTLFLPTELNQSSLLRFQSIDSILYP